MGQIDIRGEEMRVQGLLDRFLNLRFADEGVKGGSHLDEDSLTAFVEGNVGEREAGPVISHLVDCTYCLHVTSELAKLQAGFADEPVNAPVAESQPSRLSEILGGLMTKIFGTGDGVVFAHHESEEEAEEEEPKEDE
ncbi:MAG TPA: hypothetical protein PKO33_01265 [Pyrinomonadaceae bacterium]|nr:hypothetical protein [Pyrinomonadaceae bacterium]